MENFFQRPLDLYNRVLGPDSKSLWSLCSKVVPWLLCFTRHGSRPKKHLMTRVRMLSGASLKIKTQSTYKLKVDEIK